MALTDQGSTFTFIEPSTLAALAALAIVAIVLIYVGVIFVAVVVDAFRSYREARARLRQRVAEWTVIGLARHAAAQQDQGKLFQSVVVKDECPDCHGHGFYEGPSGGMSVNIFCKNIRCRSGFNVTVFTAGTGIAERISKGNVGLYPANAGEV